MPTMKHLLLSIAFITVHGFAPSGTTTPGWGLHDLLLHQPSSAPRESTSLFASGQSLNDATTDAPLANETERTAVRAPLKFIGPYPALALRFPDLATESQRQRNISGISLDFVLDTAANVNTLNAQVAQELQLDVVGQALPGVASTGAITGGDTFSLGDAQLEGINETFTFMTNLTASALPIASPAAAGLLSLAFLQCFGGVNFEWGNIQEHIPPSVTFYDDVPPTILENMQPVSIQRIPVTQLPSVTVEINGIQMPALLDTGSPVTVLNSQAAKLAGVETVLDMDEIIDGGKKNKNPFRGAAQRVKLAQAAAKGDVLQIMGGSYLVKSSDDIALTIPTASNEKEASSAVDFGSSKLFVGDLPGLAALNAIGVNAPPAVVLGTDVLRQRPNMLVRLQKDQVWF